MLTSPNRGRGQQKLASSPSGKSSSKQLLTDPSCGQSGASTSNSAHSSRSTSPMNSVFRSLKRARFLRDKFSKRSFSDSSVSMDQTGRIIKGSAGTSPSRFLYPKYEFGVEQRSTSMIVHNNHSPHNRNAAGTVRGNSTIHSPKSGLTSPKPLGRRIQSAFSPPQDGNNKRLTPEDLWSSIGLQLEDGSSGVYSLLNIDVCGCGTSVGGGGGSLFSEPLNLWRENMSDKGPRTPTTNCVRNSTNSGTAQSVGQKHTSERVPLSIKEVEKSSLLCKHTVGHVGVSPLPLSKDQSGSKFTNGAGGHSWMGLVPSYAPPPTLASTIDPSSKSDLPLLSNCAKCMCGASKGMSMTGTNVVGSQPLDRNHLTLVHTTTSGEDNRNQCRSNAGGSCNGHGGGGGSSYAKSPNANISRRVRNDLGTPRCTTRSKKFIANEETTTSIMSCHELVENARLAQGSQSTPKSRDGNNYDLQTSVTRCGRALSSSPSVTCPSFMVPNHETAEPASGVVGGASILRRNHDPSRSRSSSSSSSSVRLDDRGDFGSSSRELQEQRLNCKGIRSGELGAQRPRNSPNANTIEQLEQSRVKGDDEKSEEQECGTEVRADDSSGGRPSPGTTNIFCRHEVVEGCSVGRKPESFNESFDLSSVFNLCATTPQKGSSEQHSWNVTTHGIGIANTLEQIPKNEQINKAEALGSNYQKTTTVERDVVQKPPGQPQTSLRIVSDVPGEMEREELMDRLEQSLGYSTCRLPRVLTVAQRRRAGMVKQWSMDETKSWFYSRSSSLDRQGPHLSTQEEDPSNSGTSSPLTSSAVSSVIGGGSGGGGAAPPPVGISSAAKLSSAGTSLSGEKRRRFFQRKNTCSAPASSTESVDSSLPSRKSSQESSSVSAVSKVLEEVFRTSTLLNWDSDLDIFPSPGASQTIHSHLSSTISPPTIISGKDFLVQLLSSSLSI